ncbi:MAG: DNA polymerase III subunit gamma/tau [Clostridia bacterium]|nr:DNA polymerase III subunit gamma/tau [Clostridia bacterium]
MSEYVALYRKYRPSVFADVVGQDHITKVLRSEVMQDSVSHAYLFCGSRGTGKTTCAKILAKAVSCENPVDGDPCGVCEKCRAFDSSFDFVEMDAASHNGVENIRELQDKINFLPIEMKRRVYIIDEVHMLSTGAFNALLKTLEEPPSHIMFILATTESHKIPATILSRCKRFDFHRIGADDITKRLSFIAEKEGIGIDKDALKLISLLATGAMRDALSMLELFVGSTGVTREIAEKSLGVVGNEMVLRLIKQIADRDASGALETISDSYNASKDPSVLCSELGNMLRNLLIMKCASKSVSSLVDECADVIETLRNVEDKFTPERLLYCTEVVENTVSKLARSGLSRRTVL